MATTVSLSIFHKSVAKILKINEYVSKHNKVGTPQLALKGGVLINNSTN